MNFDILVGIAVGLFIAGLFATILYEKMNVKAKQDQDTEKSRS
jgi:tetrahydromethanopterin S-methyltransferase subunit B